MHWLIYFAVAIGVVAGKRHQYEGVEEKIDAVSQRALLKNIFELVEDSDATEENSLGFGQGNSRQGLKQGMNSNVKITEGMAQNRGMGNMGGAAGMGNMGGIGGMVKMRNRTMNVIVMSTFLNFYN
jgi:hypothetical protein